MTQSLVIDIDIESRRLHSTPAVFADLRRLHLRSPTLLTGTIVPTTMELLNHSYTLAIEYYLSDLDPLPDACSLIKLGGSLLTLPGLRERLHVNLRRLAPNPIVLVGGGGLADVVRQWDSVHGLSTSDSDALAIMTLSITAEFVRSLLPGAAIANSYDAAAQNLHEGGIPIVNVNAALADPTIEALPQGWHVTSDSMAAAIARAWGLRDLVLVKSTSCPTGQAIEQTVAEGLVDAYFPRAVRESISIRWCDGRREIWQTEPWLGVDRA